MNLHRNRIRHLVVVARKALSPSTTAQDHSGEIDERQDVRRALAAVPTGEREALVLVDWLGMSSVDAGQTLGIEASTVRVRLSRGRAKQRDHFGGTDHG